MWLFLGIVVINKRLANKFSKLYDQVTLMAIDTFCLDQFKSFSQFYSVKWGCFMIAVRIRALYMYHISDLLIFVTPFFFISIHYLNEHYFIIIYHTFTKFGTYNHEIWRPVFNWLKFRKIEKSYRSSLNLNSFFFVFFTHFFLCISQSCGLSSHLNYPVPK